MPTISPTLDEQTDLLTLLTWADEICATPGIRKAPEGWPTAACRFGQMQITPKTPNALALTVQLASACAGPSTCSSSRALADRTAYDPG
jgi:hypothetical protein